MSASGFAELLRELKNRSGHSYGTLAKRLHMSTSTLHRYCNGDAVPVDYAPVERLARLCGAAPGELVELHRRWVLADAWRGRKEPGQGERAGAGERAPGQETRLPEEAPEPEPAPVPVGEEAPEPVPEQQPGPVPEQESESVPGSGSGPVPAASVAGARRRTVLLAALAVTAVLGTVAVGLVMPFGTGSQDGKGATAATVEAADRDGVSPARTSGSATPRRSATRSASPSPSAKAPAATRSDTPEAAPSASPTRRTVTAAPPLTVNTDADAWRDPCSQHYLIDRPPSAVAPPPLEQDVPAWMSVHKAVAAGGQYVTFTVQGTGEETVVLEKLSVRMAGKRSPLAWNDYAMGYPGVGCGGTVPTRSFTVALDAMRPAPVPEAGSRGFPFKVSRSDPEVFHVAADASAYDVSWYLELSWSSGGRHGTLLIDDDGRPFRTSGNNGRPKYAYPLGGDTWRPEAEAEAEAEAGVEPGTR
ncbi:helix-turn-helix domain-containing protein [Streptomyces sp. NPDC006184]|uniref:helix-turn-helix domain-containing protein n=1 Tax=Streptomyces sp. NPDC006184 TaxID=3155455 RepID=UPI0033A0E373